MNLNLLAVETHVKNERLSVVRAVRPSTSSCDLIHMTSRELNEVCSPTGSSTLTDGTA